MEPNSKILCRYFPNCKRERCAWGHEELMSVWKTKMCHSYGSRKSCKKEGCGFAHGLHELRRRKSHDSCGNIVWDERDNRWKTRFDSRRLEPRRTDNRLIEPRRVESKSQIEQRRAELKRQRTESIEQRRAELKSRIKRQRTESKIEVDPLVHVRFRKVIDSLKKYWRQQKRLQTQIKRLN